jgi:predicted nucleic acid-binding protein
MPQRYFLDTSALVSRYLRSATGYAWMGALCDPAAGNVIGLVEITGAELAATFNQMVRGGQIRKRLCDRSLVEFWQQVDGREYHIVPVTSALVRRAADLCGVHSLKGYDAVQLAAALLYRDDARALNAATVATGGPAYGDPIFLTEDNRLAQAATAEGFAVDTPLAHP